LPFDEIQEGLALVGVKMLSVNPGLDLLWQNLVYAEGPAGSLAVKSFGSFMIEVRIIHGFCSPAFASAY
jgi:hypothetical protein